MLEANLFSLLPIFLAGQKNLLYIEGEWKDEHNHSTQRYIYEFNHLENVIGTFKIKDKGEITLAKVVMPKDSDIKEIHYAICKGRVIYPAPNKED